MPLARTPAYSSIPGEARVLLILHHERQTAPKPWILGKIDSAIDEALKKDPLLQLANRERAVLNSKHRLPQARRPSAYSLPILPVASRGQVFKIHLINSRPVEHFMRQHLDSLNSLQTIGWQPISRPTVQPWCGAVTQWHRSKPQPSGVHASYRYILPDRITGPSDSCSKRY
jgi:hypothetical protein